MEQKFNNNRLDLQMQREFCEREGEEIVYRKGDQLEREGDPARWFAVQMGSVADSVAANIRTIIDNTNFPARKLRKSGFQGKSVTSVTSIPIPEAPMGRGWAYIQYKA